MSNSDNIDHFNRVVLITLERLHQAFPVPVEIHVPTIADLASPGSIVADSSFTAFQPTFEAIVFLRNEGFLNYFGSYMDGTAFQGVQLTTKGFSALGKTIESLERKESFISKVRRTLSSGAKAGSAELAKQLVTQLFQSA